MLERGVIAIQAQYINPFLSSSVSVIEALIQVRPSVGELNVKSVQLGENHIWLSIGVNGQMNGDILFGFPHEVALKIVSGMMGGYLVTELDEMGQSAIAELGNMISGNASALLYNEGIEIDITPPNILGEHFVSTMPALNRAFTIPLKIDSVGEFNIYILM